MNCREIAVRTAMIDAIDTLAAERDHLKALNAELMARCEAAIRYISPSITHSDPAAALRILRDAVARFGVAKAQATKLGAAAHGDECPLCHSGTVELVDGEVRCRGECGSIAKAQP